MEELTEYMDQVRYMMDDSQRFQTLERLEGRIIYQRGGGVRIETKHSYLIGRGADLRSAVDNLVQQEMQFAD